MSVGSKKKSLKATCTCSQIKLIYRFVKDADSHNGCGPRCAVHACSFLSHLQLTFDRPYLSYFLKLCYKPLIKMPPQDPQTSALLAHVFQQTQSNISFLASQNYISPAEASDFISRLTTAQTRANNATNRSVDSFQSSMQNLSAAPIAAPVSPNNTGRRIPPPPPARLQRAKALWAYNEEGRVC